MRRSARSRRAAHIRRIASDAGQVLRAGPIELRVLWPHRAPAATAGAEPNDRATVLHVRDGGFDLLLTADAESNVVAGLAAAGRRRHEGAAPRQRRPGAAGSARAPATAGGGRSRSARTTRTAIRPRRRSRRSARRSRSCGAPIAERCASPSATAACACAAGSAVARRDAPSGWPATTLAGDARLQARLPDPRRRPRPHRRASRSAARACRARGRLGRRRVLRGRPGRAGHRRRGAGRDDVRDRPALPDRRWRRALEGRRSREPAAARAGEHRAGHDDRVLRARGGPPQGQRQARQGGARRPGAASHSNAT